MEEITAANKKSKYREDMKQFKSVPMNEYDRVMSNLLRSTDEMMEMRKETDDQATAFRAWTIDKLGGQGEDLEATAFRAWAIDIISGQGKVLKLLQADNTVAKAEIETLRNKVDDLTMRLNRNCRSEGKSLSPLPNFQCTAPGELVLCREPPGGLLLSESEGAPSHSDHEESKNNEPALASQTVRETTPIEEPDRENILDEDGGTGRMEVTSESGPEPYRQPWTPLSGIETEETEEREE